MTKLEYERRLLRLALKLDKKDYARQTLKAVWKMLCESWAERGGGNSGLDVD